MDTSKTHNAKVNRDRGQMNLVKLIERYGDDAKCRAFLEKLRWPDGVSCPRCGSAKVSHVKARNQFDCDSCRYQFSVTSGTVFHDTHLPLWKWFLATYLMCESKKGLSANQMKRMLGVGSYKTAWYLCHRIRSAMIEANPEKLEGVVEADETFVGGKLRRGSVGTAQEAALRRMDNKTVVLGAIERGGKLRVRVAPDTGQETIHGFLNSVIDTDDLDAIYTDGWRPYRTYERAKHQSVDHRANEWVRGDVHTNSIESAWSLFDRAVIGSYHKLSKKHLPAYLQEFEFRFNNRENPFLFRDTLVALLKGDTLTYEALVATH